MLLCSTGIGPSASLRCTSALARPASDADAPPWAQSQRQSQQPSWQALSGRVFPTSAARNR
jgi:hypothetical protein